VGAVVLPLTACAFARLGLSLREKSQKGREMQGGLKQNRPLSALPDGRGSVTVTARFSGGVFTQTRLLASPAWLTAAHSGRFALEAALSNVPANSPFSRRRTRSRSARVLRPARRGLLAATWLPLVLAALILFLMGWWFHSRYTVSLQSPILISFQAPVVVAERLSTVGASEARMDQHGRHLSAWQEYACRQFGPDCRIAPAIQRAENPQGKCEIYRYNSDGTLDWGYFQINTVHLKRPGLNLRDLLDCKANIDFAVQLYREKGGFTPWSTFNAGTYRRFMGQ
jgi:hypothetical protein